MKPSMCRPLILVLIFLVTIHAGHDKLMSNIASQFRDFHPEAIIDVGANTGSFSADLRRHFPDAAILMVEASTHHESTLQQRVEQMGNAEYRIAVLSSTAGTVVPWYQDESNPQGTGNSMFRVSALSISLSSYWYDSSIQQNDSLLTITICIKGEYTFLRGSQADRTHHGHAGQSRRHVLPRRQVD